MRGVANAVDFWGSAVPAWVGAIGGVFSAFVAVLALVSSLRAQGGVRSLQRGLNEAPQAATNYEGSLDLTSTGTLTAVGEVVASEQVDEPTPAAEPRLERLRWHYEREGQELRLINISKTQTATVTRLVILTDQGDVDTDLPLPRQVPPGGSVRLVEPRRFAGPMLTALRIEWTDGSPGASSFTLYL